MSADKLGPFELGKVHCVDCLEALPQLPEGSIAVVLTDPPFGINHPCNFRSRGRSNLATCNDYPDVIGDSAAFEPHSVLSVGHTHILWGGNWYADKLPVSGGWLVWDKERPDTLDQATCELAWTDCIKGVRRLRYLWNGMMRAGEWGQNYHPTQKPVALMKWCLSFKWVLPGIVLDPYAGAGSTGVAAVQLGRRFLGFEIDPDYCKLANDRIDAARKGITLDEYRIGQGTLDLGGQETS